MLKSMNVSDVSLEVSRFIHQGLMTLCAEQKSFTFNTKIVFSDLLISTLHYLFHLITFNSGSDKI